MIMGSLGPLFALDELFSLFPREVDGHFTGLLESQTPSPNCLSVCLRKGLRLLFAFIFISVYKYAHVHTVTQARRHICGGDFAANIFFCRFNQTTISCVF